MIDDPYLMGGMFENLGWWTPVVWFVSALVGVLLSGFVVWLMERKRGNDER